MNQTTWQNVVSTAIQSHLRPRDAQALLRVPFCDHATTRSTMSFDHFHDSSRLHHFSFRHDRSVLTRSTRISRFVPFLAPGPRRFENNEHVRLFKNAHASVAAGWLPSIRFFDAFRAKEKKMYDRFTFALGWSREHLNQRRVQCLTSCKILSTFLYGTSFHFLKVLGQLLCGENETTLYVQREEFVKTKNSLLNFQLLCKSYPRVFSFIYPERSLFFDTNCFVFVYYVSQMRRHVSFLWINFYLILVLRIELYRGKVAGCYSQSDPLDITYEWWSNVFAEFFVYMIFTFKNYILHLKGLDKAFYLILLSLASVTHL